MASNLESNEPARVERPHRKGRLGLFASIALFLVTLILSRVAWEFDHAVGNVVFAIGTILSLAILYFWLLLRRGIGWKAKAIVAVFPLLLVGAITAAFRIDGFSGELVPQFQGRWHKQAVSITSSIKKNEPANQTVNGDTTAGTNNKLLPQPGDIFYDYVSTQFFGNDRNGIFPNIDLQTDWLSNPPQELWRVPIGAGWASFALKDGLAITLEQTTDGKNENVVALRLEDGKPVWIVPLEGSHYRVEGGGGPRTTPAIEGDLVFALSSVGKFVALDLKSGEIRWQRDLLKESNVSLPAFEMEVSWGRSNSPLIIQDVVVVPVGGGADASTRSTLVAYDKASGEIRWKSGSNQISYSSPLKMTIDGVEQIVYTDEKQVAGYNIDDGKPLWGYPWSSHSNGDASVSQSAQIDSQSLFISKGYFVGCARLEVKREGEQWNVNKIWSSDKSLKTKFTSCVLHDGYAYGLNDGRLECVDLEKGERRWMKGRYGHGQVLLCKDNLIISSESGELVLAAADCDKFQEIAKTPVLDGVTWNIPTVSNDLVIMRNAKEAVCLKVPVNSTKN
jgi:outer membrane protein assembly factor BamB